MWRTCCNRRWNGIGQRGLKEGQLTSKCGQLPRFGWIAPCALQPIRHPPESFRRRGGLICRSGAPTTRPSFRRNDSTENALCFAGAAVWASEQPFNQLGHAQVSEALRLHALRQVTLQLIPFTVRASRLRQRAWDCPT